MQEVSGWPWVAALELEACRPEIEAASLVLFERDGITCFSISRVEDSKVVSFGPAVVGGEACFRLLSKDGKNQYIEVISLDRPEAIKAIVKHAIINFCKYLQKTSSGEPMP